MQVCTTQFKNKSPRELPLVNNSKVLQKCMQVKRWALVWKMTFPTQSQNEKSFIDVRLANQQQCG